jgi:hypothetical protein
MLGRKKEERKMPDWLLEIINVWVWLCVVLGFLKPELDQNLSWNDSMKNNLLVLAYWPYILAELFFNAYENKKWGKCITGYGSWIMAIVLWAIILMGRRKHDPAWYYWINLPLAAIGLIAITYFWLSLIITIMMVRSQTSPFYTYESKNEVGFWREE